MEEQNMEYIREQLHSLGFREVPAKEIMARLREDGDKFRVEGEMSLSQRGKREKVLYGIFFKKYERTQLYLPYAYYAALKNDRARSQVFGISSASAFTLPEAFNLLNGRAVNKLILGRKTCKLCPVWFQMNFNARDAHGNHRIERVKIGDRSYLLAHLLNKHGILESREPKVLSALITSLYQGNAEPVTLVRNGREIRAFVEASPRRNGLEVRTASGRSLLPEKACRRPGGKPMENLPGRRKARGKAF